MKLTEEQEKELESLKQTAYFEARKKKVMEEAEREANKVSSSKAVAKGILDIAGGTLKVMGQMGANIRENDKRQLEERRRGGGSSHSLW